MLEELKAVTVTLNLDALELLDRDADAKTLHGAGFGPDYAASSDGVTFSRSKVGGQQGQAESQQDREELAAIELMPIGRLEQDRGGDVKENAHQQPIERAKGVGVLWQ